MITYSAIEVESPSLLMILKISDMGTQGLDRKDLEETMNDELLIIPRVRDLLTDRMAYLEGEQYKLTRKGKVAAKIFIFYRKILNAGKGG
jgi:predicted transcriptional regulator